MKKVRSRGVLGALVASEGMLSALRVAVASRTASSLGTASVSRTKIVFIGVFKGIKAQNQSADNCYANRIGYIINGIT